MLPRFQEPNFRSRVSREDKKDGKVFTRLLYADDEFEARLRLEKRGLKVHDIKPYDFKEWKAKADKATRQAVSRGLKGKKFVPKSVIWGVLKDHLLDTFNGKCAYCEAQLTHVSYGDVEHFRPKGEVTEDPAHSGYYWLAYDPSNYLPSCQLCNQGSAKKNHFPIAPGGVRARRLQDPLTKEQGLLLNPYRDQVRDHIGFEPSKDSVCPGEARGKTGRGNTSIEIFELNRKPIVDARLETQEGARARFKELLNMEDALGLANLYLAYGRRMRQFCSAAMDEIEAYCKKVHLTPPQWPTT